MDREFPRAISGHTLSWRPLGLQESRSGTVKFNRGDRLSTQGGCYFACGFLWGFVELYLAMGGTEIEFFSVVSLAKIW